MDTQAKVNRTLLAAVGFVLLGGGLLVLAAGLNVYRRWALAPPDGWPLTSPHQVLLSRADRIAWSGQGWWWWPAVIAALVVAVLLALWWLLAQLRRHRPGPVAVGGDSPAEGVQVRDRALSDALAADAGRLPGVRKATARMAGRAPHPEGRIDLTLDPDSTPAQVLADLHDGPVERARRSAGWEHLPTRTRLHVAGRRPHRVE
ncbi:alkaline shock response membrane anchor protein AmaP [Streptomyces sp. NPDC088354]|uniref:alkaline shock response membrane anchor protein AmaP n=1 Tax=unclassified Streptomyces TaxID=2593676 RepID=UPI0029AB5B16|nr:alkaline shock response membrane anchor protein AmaP [Streptomyces sp. MI02-7b]MDX3075473.1 alkaline shock response membrane anchor protein AmaP [Streptomyces sp. MI02-7b]